MTASAIGLVGVRRDSILWVVPVDDQHGASRVGRDGLCDASDQHACEPGAPVGAEHDQAGVVLVGGLDDSLPGGRRFGPAPRASNPACWASRAPSAAVCSAASLTSETCAASNRTPPAGTKPTSNGCPTVITSASRPAVSCSPASSIASFASSEPSYANTAGPRARLLVSAVTAVRVPQRARDDVRGRGRPPGAAASTRRGPRRP